MGHILINKPFSNDILSYDIQKNIKTWNRNGYIRQLEVAQKLL